MSAAMVLLHLCWLAYDALLCCYPAALRQAFGAEMREDFRRQTLEAWHEGSLSAVLFCVAKECFTEGIWRRAGSPAVLVGASSLVCASVMFTGLLWTLRDPNGVKAMEGRISSVVAGKGPCIARSLPARRGR